MEGLEQEISDLKKRVAELENKVQPLNVDLKIKAVDVEIIIKAISQYFENRLALIVHDTKMG